jgi:hypothetical protein
MKKITVRIYDIEKMDRIRGRREQSQEEYHRLAPTFNRNQVIIDNLIAQIPLNINRAGKTYQKKLKMIYESVHNKR